MRGDGLQVAQPARPDRLASLDEAVDAFDVSLTRSRWRPGQYSVHVPLQSLRQWSSSARAGESRAQDRQQDDGTSECRHRFDAHSASFERVLPHKLQRHFFIVDGEAKLLCRCSVHLHLPEPDTTLLYGQECDQLRAP